MSSYQEEVKETDAAAVVCEESALTKKELLELQSVLEEDTRKYLVQWTLVSQSNFLLHFMRLGVVVVYCTSVLHNGAPAKLTGVMVTAHYWAIAVSNLYAALSLTSEGLDSVIFWHFPVLSLATLAEAMAPNFAVFAPVYVCAGMGIVWPIVPESAVMRMAPFKMAAELNILIDVTCQLVLVFGLATGGLMATYTSYRTVFLASALWAALCSVFIWLNLRGEAQNLKERRTELAAELYSQFPDAVEAEMQFPVADESEDVSEIEDAMAFLRSAHSAPYWLLSLYCALRVSRVLEFLAWWPLYARSNFDASLSSANLQSVCAVLCAVVGTCICMLFLPPTALSEAKQLNQTTLLCTVSAVLCVFILGLVLPKMESLTECWLPFVLLGLMEGITYPCIAARLVAETPLHLVGALTALRIAVGLFIPGLQHSVIGALWNVRDDHSAYLRWVAFLQMLSLAFIVAYATTRKSYNASCDVHNYDIIRT